MTDTNTPVTAEKKPRGNPAWVKKAEVISEGVVSDQWDVLHKDPKMHYVWGRKSNDEEINRMVQKGYLPARGKERIMQNPLESNKGLDGENKERGDRILMACPKNQMEARRKVRLGRFESAAKSGAREAKSMQKEGVKVESLSASETKRESIPE